MVIVNNMRANVAVLPYDDHDRAIKLLHSLDRTVWSGKVVAICDAPGFQLGSLTLMIRSIVLTLVKRRSTWAITSKTSPTIPNDTPWSTHGQGLVNTLVKPIEPLLTH
jgi:hypothetical protein